MRKFFGLFMLLSAAMSLFFSSCERVAPNHKGVLMENYGKERSDYSVVMGRVNTAQPGVELFQVPMWEQRGSFGEQILHLKDADNTEFTARPTYSFEAVDSAAGLISLVFQNSRLGSGDDFMAALQDNVIEPRIYDLIKEESKKYPTDTLMASGGNLQFEQRIQTIVAKAFADQGLRLLTFQPNLDFSKKVKEKIDIRNEVNTNLTVIDQQILEQKKKNELAQLQKEYNQIISQGLTEQLLRQQFIEKWDGKTPLYGELPVTLFKNTQ